MRLYFLRHGLADWPEWDIARDHERPLTKEGLKKMKAEAKTIATLYLRPDAILSSPYTRAYQTADIVAKELGLEVRVEPLLAPGFDLERLAELVQASARAQALLLTGHEPSFSTVITRLIGGGRVQMKKGALARVDLLGEVDEALQGELVWLLQPKTLIR
jgi:phosphohistidine phosphatase